MMGRGNKENSCAWLRSSAGMNYIDDREYQDDADPSIDSDNLSDDTLLSRDY